jgi:hypothetical protein
MGNCGWIYDSRYVVGVTSTTDSFFFVGTFYAVTPVYQAEHFEGLSKPTLTSAPVNVQTSRLRLHESEADKFLRQSQHFSLAVSFAREIIRAAECDAWPGNGDDRAR